MRKLEIESWEQLAAEELAMLEAAEPDEGMDDFRPPEAGYAVERDGHRWELDPASAEDYFERTRPVVAGPSQKWRHFGQ